MCGEALIKRVASRRITGLDLSQKSLDVAAKRGCYEKLMKADSNTKLPLPEDTFDYLMCIGTTSYLGMFFDCLSSKNNVWTADFFSYLWVHKYVLT